MRIMKAGIYRRYIKRPMDFILSFFAIIALSPILVIVAVLVKIKLGNPVIFKQKRPGLNEKIFTIYKFRTMTNKYDENNKLLPNEMRFTKFGNFLRATSIDELPELFNILKGDMSIIGPRPLLIQYLPLYNKHQKRRHEVKPGLSGLAQVNGRNSLGWEDRFDMDIQYVDNISFIGDWKIIFLTIKKVFIREGINSKEFVTMEYFTGTNKLLIVGAGGHGRAVADIAMRMNKWVKIDFLDDNDNMKTSMGISVIGKTNEAFKYIEEYEIFVAIGNNKIRRSILEQLERKGAHIPILIHPNAIVGSDVEIGAGTVLVAGAIISCCCKVGKGCIINTGSTIDHDNVIANYIHISPGVHTAGTVQIGEGSWVGVGATIINNISIIDDCIIGAGAVVVKNITEKGTYIGVPARRIE